MGPAEFEMGQIKKESDSDVSDEVFDIYRVKYEPCETELDRSESDLIDHRNVSLKYEEQEDTSAIKLNEEVDFSDLSISGLKAEQLKSEDDLDNQCEDVKHQTTDIAKKHLECQIISNSSIDSSKDHGSTNLGDNRIVCNICSKSFSQKRHLIVHEMIHTGERPFQCKICSKAFNRLNILKNHVRVHTGEKPFICQICSKAFTNSSNLTQHGRIHTGEKPFHCKICSKVFTNSSDLKAHGRIHTGEKPYHCEICSKAFNKSNNLKDHERTHTGEKPYFCKICSKAFSSSTNLKKHERIHTAEKQEVFQTDG